MQNKLSELCTCPQQAVHIKGQPLTKNLFEVQDYSAKGYALQITNRDQLDVIAQQTFKVIHFYQLIFN